MIGRSPFKRRQPLPSRSASRRQSLWWPEVTHERKHQLMATSQHLVVQGDDQTTWLAPPPHARSTMVVADP